MNAHNVYDFINLDNYHTTIHSLYMPSDCCGILSQ